MSFHPNGAQPPAADRAHVLQALIVGIVAIVTVTAAFAVTLSGSA